MYFTHIFYSWLYFFFFFLRPLFMFYNPRSFLLPLYNYNGPFASQFRSAGKLGQVFFSWAKLLANSALWQRRLRKRYFFYLLLFFSWAKLLRTRLCGRRLRRYFFYLLLFSPELNCCELGFVADDWERDTSFIRFFFFVS